MKRLHRTLLDEHFRVEGRRTWFETLEEMQSVLDQYLVDYNTKRPHQGRGMNGRTPNRVATEIEMAILDHALAHPCHGPMRVAQELMLRGI